MHVAALLYPPLILLTVRSLERHLHNWRTTSDHTCHLKRQEHTGLLNCFEGIVSVKPAEIPLLRSHDLLPAYHMPGTRLIIRYTLSRFSILPTAGKTAEAMGAYSVLPKVPRSLGWCSAQPKVWIQRPNSRNQLQEMNETLLRGPINSVGNFGWLYVSLFSSFPHWRNWGTKGIPVKDIE